MRQPISDTHSEAEKVQVEIYRRMSPEQKMTILSEILQTGQDLAMAGLRMRFPRAGTAELHRHLADLILGSDLARQVYGAQLPASRP